MGRRSFWLSSTALFVLVFCFQNCSDVRFAASVPGNLFSKFGGQASEGNGTGYDGKPGDTYYEILPGFACEEKSAFHSMLNIDAAGEFRLTYNRSDSCNAIVNDLVPSDQVDRSSYNPNFVGYREGIFEKIESAPESPKDLASSEVWCRPKDLSLVSAYDIVIKTKSNSGQKQIDAEAETEAAAEIYFKAGAEHRKVSSFAISRKVTSENAFYSAPGVELSIDRTEPSPAAWWFFPGLLRANIDSKSITQDVVCRMNAGKLLGVVEKVHPQHSQWNDYVKKSDPKALCDGNEPLRTDCIHSAEKFVVATDKSSCQGLTLEETGKNFEWVCRETPEGAKFFTQQLLPRRNLSDLLVGTAWLKNSIRILENGQVVYESLPMNWWTNPIVSLPDNATGTVTTLPGAGTVYVLDQSRTSPGYRFGADRQSLLIRPGAVLRASASMAPNCVANNSGNLTRCLLEANQRNFLWMEGWFDGAASNLQAAISLADSRFLRLQNLNVSNSTQYGIHLFAAQNSVFKDIVSHQNQYGIYSYFNSSGNMFWEIETYGNRVAGLQLDAWDNEAVIVGLKSHDNGHRGLQARSATGLVMMNSFFENNATFGFIVDLIGGSNQKLISILSFNQPIGAEIDRTVGGLFSNLATVNSDRGIWVTGSVFEQTKHRFTDGIFVGGNRTMDCEVQQSFGILNPQEGVIHRTCTDTGVDQSKSYTGHLSDATLYSGCSWDLNARALACTSFNSDNVPALRSGVACPADVHGDQVLVDPKDPIHFYLKSAVEINGDDIGNDNGLCESGEQCLRVPAFHALPRDRGPGQTEPCIFVDGKVGSVTMY